MPGMDLPVALGIAAAFGGSVAALLRGHGDVYFDSITMFIFLLLGSRYLELSARRTRRARAGPAAPRAAGGGRAHGRLSGSRATPNWWRPAQLCAGDMILVRPGEAIAADGVIVEGATEVDLALLTGESRAQPRARRRRAAGRRGQRRPADRAAGRRRAAQRKHAGAAGPAGRARRPRQAAHRAVGRQGGRPGSCWRCCC